MKEIAYCKNCVHEVKYHDPKYPQQGGFCFCEECSECRKEREKNQGWNGAI